METSGIAPALTLQSVLTSFEDEDRNRYFPLGNDRYAVRDGGDGRWRGVVTLTLDGVHREARGVDPVATNTREVCDV